MSLARWGELPHTVVLPADVFFVVAVLIAVLIVTLVTVTFTHVARLERDLKAAQTNADTWYARWERDKGKGKS